MNSANSHHYTQFICANREGLILLNLAPTKSWCHCQAIGGKAILFLLCLNLLLQVNSNTILRL